MARVLILIGDIQFVNEKICFAGAYAEREAKPPQKEALLKKE